MDLLTRSEELLLLTVWRLQEQAYGAAIREDISKKTGKDWAIGSVYGPLDRLARRGLLSTYIGSPTQERGGRSKRVYKLTSAGVRMLSHTRDVMDLFWKDVKDLVLS